MTHRTHGLHGNKKIKIKNSHEDTKIHNEVTPYSRSRRKERNKIINSNEVTCTHVHHLMTVDVTKRKINKNKFCCLKSKIT